MTRQPDRRTVLTGLGAVAAALGAQQNRIEAQTLEGAADFILFNGKIKHTLIGKTQAQRP